MLLNLTSAAPPTTLENTDQAIADEFDLLSMFDTQTVAQGLQKEKQKSVAMQAPSTAQTQQQESQRNTAPGLHFCSCFCPLPLIFARNAMWQIIYKLPLEIAICIVLSGSFMIYTILRCNFRSKFCSRFTIFILACRKTTMDAFGEFLDESRFKKRTGPQKLSELVRTSRVKTEDPVLLAVEAWVTKKFLNAYFFLSHNKIRFVVEHMQNGRRSLIQA